MADSGTIIMFSIMLTFFIALGSILPLLNDDFGMENPGHEIVGVDDSDVSGLDILFSIATVVFWSFNVNTWVNILLLEPLRIVFYIVCYRLLNPVS